MERTSDPVIIVTGANSGVGFGVCHRLLLQLSHRDPSDALQQESVLSGYAIPYTKSPYSDTGGLTLIMACRSATRAESAKQKLLALLDEDISKRQRKDALDDFGDARYGEKFRKRLRLDIVLLDLASLDSVLKFCQEVTSTYPYVSHMILNAGVGAFTGLNWGRLIYEFLINPINAVTRPGFKIQQAGVLTEDGLGWVWQSNVFSHYVMTRRLEHLLRESPFGSSRVIWMSSIEAEPTFFDADDWQCTKTLNSYEHTKHQTEIVAQSLALQTWSSHRKKAQIRHHIVHPGIVATNIFAVSLGWFLDKLMKWVFYFVRFCGSTNHNVNGYNGAISAIHLALVSSLYLPPIEVFATKRVTEPPAVRYASHTNRWGQSYVQLEPLNGWEKHQSDGDVDRLMSKFEALYEAILRKREKVDETGSFEDGSILVVQKPPDNPSLRR